MSGDDLLREAGAAAVRAGVYPRARAILDLLDPPKPAPILTLHRDREHG